MSNTKARQSSAILPKSEPAFSGLIIREKEPENLESSFAMLDGLLTPNERFYVRNHFPAPQIEAAAWRLKVEGAVENPLMIDYNELRQMASHTLTATIECAGNGRVFLTPKASGVQWELGAVGTARWTGVLLREILERAGLKEGAKEVVLEGADRGEINEPGKRSPGEISFARSLPLEKARDGDALLAFEMNGETLSRAHGFPVRAVVPGWYGMASIKWLARIIVLEEKFNGYFQSIDYAYWEARDGLPAQLKPIAEMQVKALIARPAMREVVPANAAYRIYGAAWAGEAEVAKVEVSADAGSSWHQARLLDSAGKYAWRLWEYDWQTPARAGAYALMARATDSRGRTQPLERDKRRGTYMISHVLPVEVKVR